MTRWADAPQLRGQMVLFAERLEDALPPEHCVRLLDDVLSKISWTAWEQKYHGLLGQPAIHPRVLASVLLYGLLTRIRSSRGLEEALLVRLDFRWLASGRTIDHTTLSEFRRRHAAELKDLFVQVVQLALQLGVASLARLGFDGTRVRANNRRRGTRTPVELREERDQLAAKFAEFTRQAEADDARDDELFESHSAHELPPELHDKQRRLTQIEATLQDLERTQTAGGAVPKRVPITDLDARLMPNKDGGYAPNYTPLATVDIDSGLIVAADVLNVINEDGQLIPQVEQVQRDFALTAPPQVLADELNGTGANLTACAERGIELFSPCPLPDPQNPALRADPTQPVPESAWDRLPTHSTKFDGQPCQQLDKSAFIYDESQNCYWCPLGKALNYLATTSEKNGAGRRIRTRYQAAESTCTTCPLRERCVPGKPRGRQIAREQHEAKRVQHAQKMATTEAQQIYAQRRHSGERPFAMIKHHFGLRRFLLRGLAAVQAEWLWAATAFNLHRLLSLLPSRAGPAPVPNSEPP